MSRPGADVRRRNVDAILATIRHDIAAVATNLEESKAKIASDADQVENDLNDRIDSMNKDLTATQEIPHTTQSLLSDRLSDVAVVRSDLERNAADTEERLDNDIRQKQQERFEKTADAKRLTELREATTPGDSQSSQADTVQTMQRADY